MDQGQDEGKLNPLENSLVIRKAFSYLSTKELLGVSSVNKLWNHEARCVLRDKRKCMAVIKGKKPCSRAKELNDMLGSLAVIPFNGLDVTITKTHVCRLELSDGRVEEIYGNLLKMPLKYLKFWWSKYEETDTTDKCVLGRLLLALTASSVTLEHLEIWDIPRNVMLERENGRQEETSQLPKLKTLELPLDEFLNDSDGYMWLDQVFENFHNDMETSFWLNLLRIMSERAPNLQELRNMVNLHWIQYVATENLRIFKNIKLPSRWPKNEDILMLMNKFCNEGPKISKLYAEFPRVPTGILRMDHYWTLLFDILCRSSGSLLKLTLDSRSAFLLRKFAWRMQPLANVKILEFEMNGKEEAAVSRFLIPVPLGKIFPSISAVTINWSHYRDSTVDQAGFRCGAIFPWPSVTQVTLQDYELRDQSVRELATLFPKLRTLFLPEFNNYDTGDSFRQIWSWLPRLEKLVLSITTEFSIFCDGNFDAEFCGIYEAEAAILRKKNDGYLKRVHIVPPFPPINYLRGLKSVIVGIFDMRDPFFGPKRVDSPSKAMFLSRVTGLIALRQMPNIEFELSADRLVAEHLEHLKPFLKLTVYKF